MNPFPNKPLFYLSAVHAFCLLKTVLEKEKLFTTGNFSFSNSVFYPFEIVVCKLFQFWKSLKFVVWETIKTEYVVKS